MMKVKEERPCPEGDEKYSEDDREREITFHAWPFPSEEEPNLDGAKRLFQ